MSIRSGTALTFTFPLYDPGYSRPTLKTGLTLTAGQAVITKDGGTAASTTNVPVEVSGAPGIYALTLTAAEMAATSITVKVAGTGTDVFVQQILTSGHPSGTVVANGGNSATSFYTSLTEATADYWKDALLEFTTGVLAGQVKKISAYTVTNGVITIAAFTGAPGTGDRFILINI